VILDLLLPGLDGISVLQEVVGEHPGQRVLVLSALSDVQTKVAALELGAGVRPWSVARTFVLVGIITAVTSAALALAVVWGHVPADELHEIPLMS
jgi:DNA-binding NarL/FixJ family response regulator